VNPLTFSSNAFFGTNTALACPGLGLEHRRERGELRVAFPEPGCGGNGAAGAAEAFAKVLCARFP